MPAARISAGMTITKTIMTALEVAALGAPSVSFSMLLLSITTVSSSFSVMVFTIFIKYAALLKLG